jgi:myo-inositol-1(or 4)-monophosphatase
MSHSLVPVPLDELLVVAKHAARVGAEVLASRDPSSFKAQAKSSEGDWVTAFDTRAEHAIRDYLHTARPDDTVTGEELPPDRPAGNSGYRWSIDPLDGTMNFLRNIAYYCTSVAVEGPDGDWLAGVVAAPALGRTYFATRGGGAWLEENGHVHRLDLAGTTSNGRLLATSLTADPVQRARLAAELGERMQDFNDFRRLGSAALELCAVADGGLDAYLEYGLYEHDFAAGALIAEEAGAWVRRPPLSPAVRGLPPQAEVFAAWTAAARPELADSIKP